MCWFQKRVLFLILSPFLFLSDVSLAKTKKEDIKEIAIVSLMGENFVGRKVALLKKNKLWFEPVPEWQIDNHVLNTILEFTESQQNISAQFLDMENYDKGCFLEDRVSKDCRKALFAEIKEQGFDFVLVVAPNTRQVYNNTYQGGAIGGFFGALVQSDMGNLIGGYGHYKESNMRCVFAAFLIGVYDVNTGKSFGKVRDNERSSLVKNGFPCYSKKFRNKASEDKIKWKEGFAEYSEQEKSLMKKYILLGLSDDLNWVLPKLKLFKD